MLADLDLDILVGVETRFFREFYKSVFIFVFELLLFVICFCLNLTTFHSFFSNTFYYTYAD